MSSVNIRHSVHHDFFSKLAAARNIRPLATTLENSRVSTGAWWTMLACSLTALATSGYLAWSSLTSSPVAGCGGGSVFDCSHVLHTRWSTVLSVPVSIPAIAIHLTILCLLLTSPASAQLWRARMAAIGFTSLAAGAAAVWFICLQFFVIRHLCPYCLVAHTAGLILAAIFLWERPVSSRSLKWIGSGALASLAILAALQLTADAPPTYETI